MMSTNNSMYVSKKNESLTYTEIFICQPGTDLNNIMNTSNHLVKEIPVGVTEDFFLETLTKISKKKCPYKFFKKSYRTYVYQNIILENRENKDGPNIEVYTKQMKMYALDNKKSIVHIAYYKQKQPFHVFPSTTYLNDIMFTKRLSFLVTSHIYINFDITYPLNKESKQFNSDPLYKIFINFNTDKNVDIESSKKIIDDALCFIQNK